MRNEKGVFIKGEPNEVEMKDGYALVWVTNKEGERKKSFKVDFDDLEKVLEFRWSESTDGYAKHRSLKMHRLIIGAKEGEIVDHINEDKADNRKCNLRIVDHSLNMRNSTKTKAKSGHRGIGIENGKYKVQFRCRGVRYYFGLYETLEEALEVLNKAKQEVGYNV